MDLSILIPARGEEFLAKTIENILENIEGKTEIIAVLDGEWANPAIKDDPRVTILHYSESVGQRVATNNACKLSRAKYVMKVDAHCAFDKGFDVKMMADMQDDWTMVPVMKNLHAFNWKCKKCGNEWYQGPTPTECKVQTGGGNHGKTVSNKDCGNKTDFEKVVYFEPNPSPNSTAFRFDKTLHFQYWGAYKKQQEGDLVETMSLQGSCFMMTRKKYWELDVCSEKFNSWGQQGVEVACKTWLSGGRVICNKKTWYAHLFRTQGGDFSFPYNNPESKIEENRKLSRELFIGDNWGKAIHPFSWLLEKFNPPDWDLEGEEKGLSSGIIYYTDNQLNMKLARKCRKQIAKSGLPIVSTSLKPLDFGKNFVIKGERGQLTMFRQILKALEESDSDIIFFCEHDVLYHPSNFNFRPEKKDVFYYNDNLWRVRLADGFAVKFDHKSLSQICAYRETLIKEFKHRVEDVEKNGFHNGGYEPGTRSIKRGGFSDSNSEHFHSEEPNIDIRHDKNLSASKWKPEDFKSYRSCRNWEEGNISDLWGNNILNKKYEVHSEN